MKLNELKTKNIAIWGYGVEGKATAKYFSDHNINFTVLCKVTEVSGDFLFITDEVDVTLLNKFDVIVKSPGISAYLKIVKQTQAQITSSTAIWFANEKHTFVIAITGTKGKSTSCSLLAHIINACGKKVNLVGNIGKPLITSTNNYDYIVLESSSFQIYDGNIHADIAVVLNLYAEHLDWHDGIDNYFLDKLKIFDNAKVKIDLKSSPFSIKARALYFQNQQVIKLDEIKLIGEHNLENIAAVLMVCDELNLDKAQVIKAIKSFEPLDHRLQDLGKIAQFYAINDSIATTPMATIAALKTVDLETTTLIIGGYDRGHDWLEFTQLIAENAPQLVIVNGQNTNDIVDLFKQQKSPVNYLATQNLKQAIQLAVNHSKKNTTILLSPGAPSFDQFDDYKIRGEFFKAELKSYEI